MALRQLYLIEKNKKRCKNAGIMTNEGFLLVNKPAGITSHDVVDRIRRITGIRKVGHAGTLDPFATGLLIIGVGRSATREMQALQGLDKAYEALFVLGASSDTDDKEGKITQKICTKDITNESIDHSLKDFLGTIEQIPPMYAAIKVKGKKLYELAREGKTIERKAREVTIYNYQRTSDPVAHESTYKISFSITCSTGTYIRALARDLGEKFGGGGYVEALERTSISHISLKNAQTLEEIKERGWESLLIDVEHLKQQLSE
jgi:tRNA pseudouridine55 synthase